MSNSSSPILLPTRRLGDTILRPAAPDEVQIALRQVLSTDGKPADDIRVVDFLDFAIRRQLDLSRLMVADRQGKVIWALLPILGAGRTVLLLAPGSTSAEVRPDAAELIEASLAGLSDVHLVQALIDPGDISAALPFEDAHFARLATLIYLQKSVPEGIRPVEAPKELHAFHYSTETHALFRTTIEQSYIDSRDCASLTGLRDMDDIVASHKGAVTFMPELWTVLKNKDEPAAVLLLGPTGRDDTMELVYLGIAPKFRHRGLGKWAMRHAIAETSRMRLPRLTLAVDSINAPAMKLYLQSGMQRVQERLVLLRDLRVHAAEPQSRLAP